MQTIGLITAVLFVAALASFMLGFFIPDRFQLGAGFGAFFIVLAFFLLAVTIRRRTRTERI